MEVRRKLEEDSDFRGGGAGGKMTKRSFRVHSTPYDRPPPHTGNKKNSGWFSKLLPSIFSSKNQQQQQQQRQDSPPPPPLEDAYVQESLPENEPEDCATVPALNSSDVPDAPAEIDQTKVDSNGDKLVGDKLENTYDGCGLAEIEHWLQQKKFSRDETNHLIELLRSRTSGLPDGDGYAMGHTVEATEGTLSQKDSKKTAKEEHHVQSSQKDSKKTAKEEHHVQSDCMMIWNTSDQLQKAHDASSSPVEIAKAYMETVTSASDYDCRSGRLRNDRSSASKVPSAHVMNSPLCWPGAVVRSDHGYFTPQRDKIHPRPSTPYSGGIFSKSNSKFQVNGEKAHLLSAKGKQSTTYGFGGNMTAKRMKSVMDDGFASVGPIQHVYQKNITKNTSKSVGPSNLAASFSLSNRSDALHGFCSTKEGDFEYGSSKDGFCKFQSSYLNAEESKLTAGSSTVHPQSSEMARKILEHLDRAVMSPKEKSLELKLAVARREVPPKSAPLVIGVQDERPDMNVSDEHNTNCLFGGEIVSQESRDAQKGSSVPYTGIYHEKDRLFQTGKQGVLGLVQGASSAAYQITKNGSCLSHKSSIPSAKPSKRINNCDNGFSFTFPVQAVPSSFSEPPPTPTMASSLTASRKLEASGEEVVPSFNFPSEFDDRLEFSFGSSSPTDTTTPYFKFGTENEPRLSFGSFGKNAICY